MRTTSAFSVLLAAFFLAGVALLAGVAAPPAVGEAAGFASPAFALPQHGEDEAEEADTTEADTAATDSTEAEEEEDEGTKFEEVVEDCTVIEGLFNLYHKEEDGSVYLEILPDQFDRIYLCSITREAGDGTYLDSGAMAGSFPFVFHRVGKRVQWLHKNVYFQAKNDPDFARAIERGVSHSLMASGEVEGLPHEERGSVLVKLSDYLMKDLAGIGYVMSEWFKAGYSFDKDDSYFSKFKSFPENTEVEVTMHFKSGKPNQDGGATMPDTRSFFTRYHYSWSTLPETGYMPRIADDRVGYFTTMYQDYSDMSLDSPYVRYINRWHLKKKNPSAKVSEPVEPVVYWLENTIPEQFRDAVAKGVTFWNSAFEGAGFKNALVVKQMPDDAEWDPADVRYNTIRWILAPGGGYAVGPSLTNPFTGQIYAADIRVSADMMRYVFKEFEEFVDPVAWQNVDAAMQALGLQYNPASGALCNYADGASLQASFGWSVLSMRGVTEMSRKAKDYMDDFLIAVVSHEVGHTIGMRHNFKASSIHGLDDLSNSRVTKEKGLTASTMDYTPVSVCGNGRKQGEYWQTTPGTYDRWNIEYGYTPIPGADTPEEELSQLAKIASRAADPYLVYSTDEDTWGFSSRSIDPTSNLWDLGADPLAWYGERIMLANELWDGLEETFEKEGMRYQKIRKAFGQAVVEYFVSGLNASKYIGGIYHRRDHIGDPNGRVPFEPVSAEKQRKAMALLTSNYFSADAFVFDPELLSKLAPERQWDFTGSLWAMTRLDYPVHNMVLAVQSAPINRMYDPITMNRLVDMELYFEDGEEPFTLAEMFVGMRKAIWSELEERSEINSFRRNLQRLHLDRLVTLTVAPPPGSPPDATTLARADLVAIKNAINGALYSEELDYMTRAHLEETSSRVAAALEAGMNLAH